MDGAVVRPAERCEFLEGVRAAFGARHEMVHIREDRVAAARDTTFPAVPAQDRAAEFGGYGLRGAA